MQLSSSKVFFSMIFMGVLLYPAALPLLAERPDTPAKRVTIGGKEMSQRLRYKVAPVYPVEAREAGIVGIVKLTALIGTDGSIQQLSVNRGHPLLVKAALDAVKQWKYDPVILDGSPVEVVTAIDVVFELRK